MRESHNNSIYLNNLSYIDEEAIMLNECSNNTVYQNFINKTTGPTHSGIQIGDSSYKNNNYNKIYWNLLESNYYLPPSAYEVMFISSVHKEKEVEGLAVSILDKLKSIN